MADLRFSTAMQALLLLADAARKGTPLVSSAQLADCLRTNPSFVRSLLIPLFQAGLIETVRGRNGGVQLAKDAARITLLDVHQASVCGKPMWLSRPDERSENPAAIRVQAYFDRLNDEAAVAVAGVLRRQTLAGALEACLDQPTD
ncbi:Rrf2 family transcriptional regulator [Kribbella sp. NPDC050241]|uniref:Rrf2 family transcriptional regulator n=1 Tax=Kribbella sp. NPDC050241 TaxID=3364115 RepID=UPI0037B68F47